MKHYKAHLFDLDGTLVNSEPLKGKAIAIACSNYGPEPDFQIYKTVMGENWQKVTEHFFSKANIAPDITEFNHIFRTTYENLLQDHAQLTKHAHDYLQSLQAMNCKIALVSSAATWAVEHLLDQLNISTYFEVIITKEDVAQHKPHPEAYQLALSKLSMTKQEAIIYEDSFAGLSAAQAAGCDAVAIRHDFNGGNDLSSAKKIITHFGISPQF